MKRKAVSGIMLTLLLTGMLMLQFNIQPVKSSGWTGTVYIRADGSVNPPDAPIITLDNVTYTLTDNITSTADGMVIERDNIIIDGAGYTIQGTREVPYRGINLGYRANVNITIKNIYIKNFYEGIWLWDSSCSSIYANNIKNNEYGIRLYYSSNNNIYANDIKNNEYGIDLQASSANIIYGNNIKNNGVAIRLYSSSANNLSENSIATNIHVGIMLEVYSPYNIISGNNITNNYDDGIRLYDSSNNIISGNNIRNNDDAGIYLYGSSYNTISGNDIENNGIGILIEGVWSVWGIIEPSDYNIISENNIKSNGIGIYLFSSSYNDISRNNIVINGDGILFYESFENGIYHNNIIDNWHQARTPYEGYYNRWDIGYPSGGNYWSDYTGVDLYSGLYQNETGSDGIGDTPYVIDAYNQDNYPLMKPWGMPSGMSANLVRRKAWPEHRHFVLSKDGNQTVEDRHGTPGYQTLYGIVENTGNITLPAGTYKVLWNITTETGYVKSVKTFGAVDLAPGELTTLTYDVPAQDLPPDKYYVKAQCYYYYAVEGERTKTFIFTVVP